MHVRWYSRERLTRSLKRSRYLFRVILLAALFIPANLSVRIANGDDALVESLRAGHEAWLRQVEFASTYEVYQGEADSLEQALNGTWKKGRDLLYFGEFHKRGTTVRCSKKYPHPPREVGSSRSHSEMINVPIDEVSGDILNIQFRDRPDLPAAAVAWVTATRREYAAPLQGYWMSSAFGPLCHIAGSYRNPFDIFANVEDNESVQRTAREVDDQRVEVTLSAVAEPYAFETKLMFRLDAAPPVIEFARLTERRLGDRRPGNSTEQRASDFVDCPGGKVARVIRVAFENSGRFIGREWISKDLGDRPPTDADFQIRIPAYARVGGLIDPPPKGTERTLSLNDFTLDDLRVPDSTVEPIIATSGFPSGYVRPLWGVLAVLGIALLVVGYVWRRRWSHS